MAVWKSSQMLKLIVFGALVLAGVTSLLTNSYAGALLQPAQQAVAMAGTYTGNVIVSEPAPLGALTLALGITNNGGVLSGKVDPAQTMVFLGGPTFTGQVTEGATPTFQIASETFTSVVSKRTIQRSFILTGEVLNNGDSLKGDYVETITGFTPAPMVVKGKFLLARPTGSQIVLPSQVGGTPTTTPISPKPGITPVRPTPRPSATPVTDGNNDDNNDDNSLLLPFINSGQPEVGAAQATPVPGQTIYLPATTKGE